MDIKDLNKKQMILVVLLVCFIVSIATGIVTVSLMQQVPKSVPQTINRVIERTINNVTSTPVVNKEDSNIITDSNVVVEIYKANNLTDTPDGAKVLLGTGVIISDIGLVLVDNTILDINSNNYQIMLEKNMYQAEVLKKFNNGFSILKILPKVTNPPKTEVIPPTSTTPTKDPAVDIKP
jgi:hypothetical protein